MSTMQSKTMALALVSRTRAGMATKDDTLAQDEGDADYMNTWGKREQVDTIRNRGRQSDR